MDPITAAGPGLGAASTAQLHGFVQLDMTPAAKLKHSGAARTNSPGVTYVLRGTYPADRFYNAVVKQLLGPSYHDFVELRPPARPVYREDQTHSPDPRAGQASSRARPWAHEGGEAWAPVYVACACSLMTHVVRANFYGLDQRQLVQRSCSYMRAHADDAKHFESVFLLAQPGLGRSVFWDQEEVEREWGPVYPTHDGLSTWQYPPVLKEMLLMLAEWAIK